MTKYVVCALILGCPTVIACGGSRASDNTSDLIFEADSPESMADARSACCNARGDA